MRSMGWPRRFSSDQWCVASSAGVSRRSSGTRRVRRKTKETKGRGFQQATHPALVWAPAWRVTGAISDSRPCYSGRAPPGGPPARRGHELARPRGQRRAVPEPPPLEDPGRVGPHGGAVGHPGRRPGPRREPMGWPLPRPRGVGPRVGPRQLPAPAPTVRRRRGVALPPPPAARRPRREARRRGHLGHGPGRVPRGGPPGRRGHERARPRGRRRARHRGPHVGCHPRRPPGQARARDVDGRRGRGAQLRRVPCVEGPRPPVRLRVDPARVAQHQPRAPVLAPQGRRLRAAVGARVPGAARLAGRGRRRRRAPVGVPEAGAPPEAPLRRRAGARRGRRHRPCCPRRPVATSGGRPLSGFPPGSRPNLLRMGKAATM